MCKVFVSYAREDGQYVDLLATALESRGISCWIDRQETETGHWITSSIDSGLLSADWAILILSRHYFEKHYTIKELNAIMGYESMRPFSILYGITGAELARRSPMLNGAGWIDGKSVDIPNVVSAFLDARLPPPRLEPGETRRNRNDQLRYVYISPGTFLMGSEPNLDRDAESNEAPVHTVSLRGFWMCSTPVTVGAYALFQTVRRGLAITDPASPELPYVRVDWADAMAYANWAGGDLPTEAQWERAARGGQVGCRYPCGNVMTAQLANYRSDPSILPLLKNVASCRPNGFGLFDMAGNIEEWTRDDYAEYSPLAQDNPVVDRGSFEKVVRGGSYRTGPERLRVSYRRRLRVGTVAPDLGFRVALPEKTLVLESR